MHSEAFGEEALDTLDITSEIKLSIKMRCGHHLWKINYCDLFIFVDHEIELVKITMNETMPCKLDDELHESVIDCLGVV